MPITGSGSLATVKMRKPRLLAQLPPYPVLRRDCGLSSLSVGYEILAPAFLYIRHLLRRSGISHTPGNISNLRFSPHQAFAFVNNGKPERSELQVVQGNPCQHWSSDLLCILCVFMAKDYFEIYPRGNIIVPNRNSSILRPSATASENVSPYRLYPTPGGRKQWHFAHSPIPHLIRSLFIP